MKTVFLFTSPKKRFSNSNYLSSITKFATRSEKVSIKYEGIKDLEKIFNEIKNCDNLVISTPLYVDSIPSHLLILMQKIENYVKENNLHFNLYSYCNCGFYEGVQTEYLHQMFKIFANKCKLEYKGGVGVGAGEMLGVLRLNYIVAAVHFLINLIIAFVSLAKGGNGADFSHALNPISFMITVLVAVLFSLGAYLHSIALGISISKSKDHKIKYTTVWFCPKFLFVFFASIYWFIRSLILHGSAAFKLFNKSIKEE